jgi:hypothetical protein
MLDTVEAFWRLTRQLPIIIRQLPQLFSDCAI